MFKISFSMGHAGPPDQWKTMTITHAAAAFAAAATITLWGQCSVSFLIMSTVFNYGVLGILADIKLWFVIQKIAKREAERQAELKAKAERLAKLRGSAPNATDERVRKLAREASEMLRKIAEGER